MAPSAVAQVLLSPAELSYLHASLSLAKPLRPDGRSLTQFRPLIAEQDILPSTNGSARVCFADGTEAIVGIKAAVEKTSIRFHPEGDDEADDTGMDMDADDGTPAPSKGQGDNDWVEMSIEIPGFRDDDALPVFLSAMLTEALLASGDLKDRLWINRRFHWKLYIDVCCSITFLHNLLIFIGTSTICTIIISIASTINHDTSGFALCTSSQARIRRR
jgi:exosome complex component RRP42